MDKQGNIRPLAEGEEAPEGTELLSQDEVDILMTVPQERRPAMLQKIRSRPKVETISRSELRLAFLGGGGVQPPPSMRQDDGFRAKQSRADRRREFRKNAAAHRRSSGHNGEASR